MKKIKKMNKIKEILLYIWQLPQNLLGLIMLLFMKPYVSKEKYDTDLKVAKESTASDSTELETLRADKAKLEKDIEKVKFDSAVELKLATSGARNTRALRGLIDMDKLSMGDNGLEGFDEQLTAIKAENDYLFTMPTPMAGGMPQGGSEPKLDGVEKAFAEKNPDLKID